MSSTTESNPRPQYANSAYTIGILVVLGLILFGQPYFKLVHRQLFVSTISRDHLLSIPKFELAFEKEFEMNDQLHRLFVMSKSNQQVEDRFDYRIIITDENYNLVTADQQNQMTLIHNVCIFNQSGTNILELVREREGSDNRIHVHRYDVTPTGIRVTRRDKMLPIYQMKTLVDENNRNAKIDDNVS